MQSPRSADQIIDDLYAGTLDSSAWDRALIGMADWIGSSGALLLSVNPTTAVILRDEIHRLDSDSVLAYRKHWITQDIRLAAAMQVPIAEPMFERILGIEEKWKRAAIFNDFAVPQDMPYFLATWLHKAPDKVVALSFQGSCRRGPFDESDSRRTKSLMPHLRRAFEIRDRLEMQQIRADTLSSAIEGLQFGLFVLDEKGCILDASGLAQEMLRREPSIRREKDHTLWLREPAGSQLRSLVRNNKAANSRSGGGFNVPRDGGLQSLSVLVSPMPAVPVTWTGADPRWLVFIFDPERRVAPAASIIAVDLGISEREAEIAALLAIGYDLSCISQRLSISIHTARSHLKHIFSKTGIQSQSDLIRRILTSPAAYSACRTR
jgi:DNA-binding CsgD family transcriptional regulator